MSTLMRRWRKLSVALLPVAIVATVTYVAHESRCSGVNPATAVVDTGYDAATLRANGYFGDPHDGREWLYPADCVDEVMSPVNL